MGSRSRPAAEIPSASMADVAFLLLIFFLLVTTIDTDKGIARKLPPMPKTEEAKVESKVKQRNVFEVRINSRDYLLVEGNYATIKDLKQMTKDFILNPLKKEDLAESPQKAVVSLKNDRGTTYETYLMVQNELTAAYNELRNEESLRVYGKKLDQLTSKEQEKINAIFPMKVSEAEPENIGGNK
jgi:biopolymer transport protein ExbD